MRAPTPRGVLPSADTSDVPVPPARPPTDVAARDSTLRLEFRSRPVDVREDTVRGAEYVAFRAYLAYEALPADLRIDARAALSAAA